MHLIRRRRFVRGMGLGAGAGLLAPLVRGLLAEAEGATINRKRLVVLTAGNGWGHQGQPRNPMAEGGNLFTRVRSETDWDLPAGLAPLAPYKAKVSIAGVFFNPHGGSQHGNGIATLSVVPPTSNGGPGGPSIDRYVGSKLYPGDAFASVVLAPAHFGNTASPAEHTSADGVGQLVSAPNTPAKAFDRYLGALGPAAPSTPTSSPKPDPNKSLIDSMLADVERVRAKLAGAEQRKLDQILDSTRALEKRLQTTGATPANGGKPSRPEVDATGLRNEVIRGFTDVAVQALAFGVSHVVHLSVLGNDAFNDAWSGLGLPYDAHEALAHVKIADPPAGFDFTQAQQKIIAFHAAELAHLFDQLKAIPEENGTMADQTLAVWVNSGGGKHHDGGATIPLVFVGDLGGQFKQAGKYTAVAGPRCISDAYVSVANAVGLQTNEFGDPAVCDGPVF